MTDPDDEPTGEDRAYAMLLAFIRRYGFTMALIAPLVIISLVPMGPAGVLVAVVIYLGEAVVYVAMQRRRRRI